MMNQLGLRSRSTEGEFFLEDSQRMQISRLTWDLEELYWKVWVQS